MICCGLCVLTRGNVDKHIYCQLMLNKKYIYIMNASILKREKSFVADKCYTNLVSDILLFMKLDLH
jgi:hypothetical protein